MPLGSSHHRRNSATRSSTASTVAPRPGSNSALGTFEPHVRRLGALDRPVLTLRRRILLPEFGEGGMSLRLERHSERLQRVAKEGAITQQVERDGEEGPLPP